MDSNNMQIVSAFTKTQCPRNTYYANEVMLSISITASLYFNRIFRLVLGAHTGSTEIA